MEKDRTKGKTEVNSKIRDPGRMYTYEGSGVYSGSI